MQALVNIFVYALALVLIGVCVIVLIEMVGGPIKKKEDK